MYFKSNLLQFRNWSDVAFIGVPYVPILFPKERYTQNTVTINEIYEPSRITSVGLWCLGHMQNIDPDLQFWRALYTNGHQWKLFEIHDDYIK